jgi:hypothetical protein
VRALLLVLVLLRARGELLVLLPSAFNSCFCAYA